MRHLVYVARGRDSGLYKIGCSIRPADRARTLANQHREAVEIVAVFPGDCRVERRCHKAFDALLARDANRGREWFRDDGRISAWVNSLPAERKGSVIVEPTQEVRGARPRLSDEEHERRRRVRSETYARWAARAHQHPAGHPYTFQSTCRACARWVQYTLPRETKHDRLPAFVRGVVISAEAC